MSIDDKDMFLNMKDLLAYVLKHWLFILICLVLGTVLYGGLKTNQAVKKNNLKFTEEKRNEYLNALTESEILEVESLFNKYIAYRNGIENSEQYFDNSLLMRLNANSLPTIIIQYSIMADRPDVLNSFRNLAFGIDEYKEFAKVYGETIDYKYVSELVAFSESTISDTSTNGYLFDVDNHDDLYVGNIDNAYKQIMEINIYAESREQCEEIESIVERAIEKQYTALKDAGVGVELTKIGSSYSDNSAKWLADLQRNNLSMVSTLRNDYSKFESDTLAKLTTDEKAYYSYLKDCSDNKLAKIKWKKNCILGGAIGIAFSLIVLVLLYLFSETIRTAGEFETFSNGESIIDTFYSVKHTHGVINKFINKIANKIAYGISDDSMLKSNSVIIYKRVMQLCSLRNVERLYVLDEAVSNSAHQFLEGLVEYLKSEGITVEYGRPLESVDDMCCFEKYTNMIRFVELCKTNKNQVSRYSKLITERDAESVASIAFAQV